VKGTRLRMEAAREIGGSVVSSDEFEIAYALSRDFAVIG
jgi:hypothetical protein